MDNTIYQFTVNDLYGNPVSLSEFKGKVLLIVNTASQCGFTPQLQGLQDLYDEFKNDDFEILGFPSNDFAGQEPLKGKAIQDFCQINYGVNFKMFEKVSVKGDEAHDLYKFLSKRSLNGVLNSKPRWNFHKYLIDKQGKVRTFYYSFTKPNTKKIKKKVAELINE